MICHNFEQNICHSCDLLGLGEEGALSHKISQTKEVLEIANFDTVTHFPALHHRNKVKWAVSGTKENPLFGFFNQSLEFTELKNCPVLMEELDLYQSNLKKVINDFNLTPYDPKTNKGELKYIILFATPDTKNFSLRFVLRSKEALSRLVKLDKTKDVYDLQSIALISINIQPERKAIVEGNEEIPLTNSKNLTFTYGDFKINLGFRSFFQVNHKTAMALYQKARTLVSNSNEHILDLYCGVGGFALSLAGQAKKVTGIEISTEAIESANKSAKDNQFSHLEFLAGDLSSFDLSKFQGVDVCVVNPPRRGLDKMTTDFLKELRPQKIIYSSCNPQTLKRDIELLKDLYTPKSYHAFDMFGLTHHLEVLVDLVKK